MAIFESLANALKALAVGDRVKVTPSAGNWTVPKSYGRENHTERCFRKLFIPVGTRRHPG